MAPSLALAQERVNRASLRYREARRSLRFSRGMAVPSPWEDDVASTQVEYAEAEAELRAANRALSMARRWERRR